MQNYAQYEQLVGGVDTLFKKSSKKVQEYASNAYKTAGMSANEYMETVTSFSASLLQSLENDTEAAAEYANMAITDMSDNANKMGTSMEMIQNAYNGFAKQNYTMLDNLKLGYGGTKEEMERLLADADKLSDSFNLQVDASGALVYSYADIVDAIHIVQTEMGITGTTAKEAGTTIQGSVDSMKAAWTNLVTGLGDENANIEQLFDDLVVTITGDGTETNLGVMGTVIPRIKVIFGKVTEAIKNKLSEVDWEAEGEKLAVFIGNGIDKGVELLTDIGAKIKAKIDSTDWYKVGEDIATFVREGIVENIANIDWEQVLLNMRTNYRESIRDNMEMWGGLTGTDVTAAVNAFDQMGGDYSTAHTSSSGRRHGGGSIDGGGSGWGKFGAVGYIVNNINVQGNLDQAALEKEMQRQANDLANMY